MRPIPQQRLGLRLRTILFVIAMLPLCAAHATASTGALERYQLARAALRDGDMARYDALAVTLRSYILYPYLQFAYLQATLHTATAAEIDDFLRRNVELPIAGDLRQAWLLELARRTDWSAFLAADTFGGDGAQVACARAAALAATGQTAQAAKLAERLWLVGYHQPDSCGPVFTLLQVNGRLPSELVRRRLLLALRAGNPDLARYLATQLPNAEQAAAQRWLDVYARPTALLTLQADQLGGRQTTAQVATAALLRMGRKQPADAHALWARLAPRFDATLDAGTRNRIARTIAVFAAIDSLPQAEAWLAALPAAANTDASREWRARAALRSGDWPGLLAAVRAMPRWQRDQGVWRYWEARAQLQTGDIASGRALANRLADRFSYYGFLAADLVQRPYAEGPQPEAPDPALQKKVGGMYLARIALALHQAGQTSDAGAAWRTLIHRLAPNERLAAARLAQRQDWAYAAYTAAAQAGAYGSSPLTFPLAHWHAVRTAARGNDLSPALVLAMMRQESAFQSAACSSAGACGLMQLLPATACWIGKRTALGSRLCDRKHLDKPDVSIRAGSAYLSYLVGLFANDIVAAVAAYNAGPTTVSTWLAEPALRADTARWIATLPFDETRRYLQAVLFNRVVYGRRSELPHAAQADSNLRLSDLFGSLNQQTPSG